MRRAVQVVISLLAALVLVGLSGLVYLHHKHPRDEAAFLDSLYAYGGPDGEAMTPTRMPADDALVEEGDTACHWLSVQPYALWRHGSAFRYQSLLDSYTAQPDLAPVAWSAPGRETVARAAWNSLCPATWELHRPHVYEPAGD